MILTNSSALALLGLVVSVATVGFALVYAFRPRESLLVLMRPLSLAAIFGGLSACTIGIVSVLRGVSNTPLESPIPWHGLAAGMAEQLAWLRSRASQ